MESPGLSRMGEVPGSVAGGVGGVELPPRGGGGVNPRTWVGAVDFETNYRGSILTLHSCLCSQKTRSDADV